MTHFFPLNCAITSSGVTKFVGRRVVYSLSVLPSNKNLTVPSFFLTARMLLQKGDGSKHSLKIPPSSYWSIFSRISVRSAFGTGVYRCICGSELLMGLVARIPFASPKSNGCLLNAFWCFWKILIAFLLAS